MRRRGVTVILGALITALLAGGVMAIPLPYVVLKPGPTVNTLGSDNGKEVIQVTKADTSTSKGQLRLTTVGVQPSVELVWAIRGWFSDEQAVVPRELIYPPDQSEQQVEEQNAEEFKSSQHSAVTVALRELGYPVQTFVTEVSKDGPSAGVLQKDDVITSVDGTEVTSPDKLTQLVQAKLSGYTAEDRLHPGGQGRHRDRDHEGRRERRHPAHRRRHRQEAAAPVRRQHRPGRDRRPQRRPDVHPGHHRQAAVERTSPAERSSRVRAPSTTRATSARSAASRRSWSAPRKRALNSSWYRPIIAPKRCEMPCPACPWPRWPPWMTP
nr:hypothetical protein GCM10020092_013310 [Actinoplanes digitatis]